jgi:hypothetical protein
MLYLRYPSSVYLVYIVGLVEHALLVAALTRAILPGSPGVGLTHVHTCAALVLRKRQHGIQRGLGVSVRADDRRHYQTPNCQLHDALLLCVGKRRADITTLLGLLFQEHHRNRYILCIHGAEILDFCQRRQLAQ